ncbi:GDSL esterase/lipase At2g31540-like isoform X2 [Tasmannia lanceolata]|uniref:GDSL esterase/lipase At2g31540-like isoform X2 n=1 Tax=Tasmannia lanceolata TaxID=3420 RepID=UPI0040629FF6
MSTILLSLLILHLAITLSTCQSSAPAKFPAILVFGDSTVDTGNNNYVGTAFRADHPPYGLKFPEKKATGRFSDGMLVPDLLVSRLGLKKTIPPFLDPALTDDDVRTGVCFASSGSGFDELTTAFSGVIPVLRQLDMFKDYLARLKGVVGDEESSKIINGALILISAGTNDFVFNFYDLPTRRVLFNISEYQDFLHQKLHDLVKLIYDLGGRKFIIAGLPPIGCVPLQITAKFKKPSERKCLHDQNADAIVYNSKLQNLLPKMQAELSTSKFSYVNIYDPAMDMINNPNKYGFVTIARGCCGTGFLEVGPLCNVLTPPCPDSSKSLFWDAVHPTEAVYRIVTDSLVDNILKNLV